MVTSASAALMLAALWLFWHGDQGWGLLAGWVMTFLDTVDGKLARVTLTATRFGYLFDHGMDVVHPPFWYAAWGFGLSPAAMSLPPAWLAAGLRSGAGSGGTEWGISFRAGWSPYHKKNKKIKKT